MTLKGRFVFALACGMLAVALMTLFAARVRGEAAAQRTTALERYGGETVAACVAVRDIAQGEVFSERNVEPVEWLVDLLPEGAIVDYAGLMGQTAASAVARNTPLAAVDVAALEDPLDVPAGMVAVSVPCSNESAVGGALHGGSVVDVYVLGDGAARLLCPAVQVLQTNAAGTSASLAWAVLAVEPSEVEALIAAAGLQRLHFVLPSDEEVERRGAQAQLHAAGPDLEGAGGTFGGPVLEADGAAVADGPAEGTDVPVEGAVQQ